MATGYEMDGLGSIPDKVKEFSLLYNVHTGSEVHPVSYPMVTEEFFSRGVK
jgi:hypothetical protein